MKQYLRILSSQNLEETPCQGIENLSPEKNYLLEIKTNSGNEVRSFLEDNSFDEHLIELVEDPSKSTRVNVYGDSLIMT